MSKRAYDKIAEGLLEAIAVARHEHAPAKLHVPPEIDVRSIRAGTGLTQEAFASAFGFSVSQIREWERSGSRNRPTGSMRAYLMVIAENPTLVMEALKRAASAHRRIA